MSHYYIQFFNLSTGYVPGSVPPRFDDAYKTLQPACGDRAVIRVDGRTTAANVAWLAVGECTARGFAGYQVMRGSCLRDAQPVSGVWPVATSETQPTARSASMGA